MNRTLSLLKTSTAALLNRMFSTCPKTPPDPAPLNVTILGNMVPTVDSIALLLKQYHGIDEIRLYGTNEIVCNAAMDLAQMDTNTLVKAYMGDNRLLRDAIADAKIILICGGNPVSHHLKEMDVFDQNVGAFRNIALQCIEHNPRAIILVATPPINYFVPLISEEYKKAGVYDPRKIIGVSTLSTVIANSLIGKYLKCNPTHVHCPVIGGDSVETRVPILSQCVPSLDSCPEEDRIALYDTIVKSPVICLERKETEELGPLYLSQAFAIARFVINLVNALHGDANTYECSFVRQTGHLSTYLPYMQSIVKLGPEGVADSFMPRITDWECARLVSAYPRLKRDIHLGASYVNGELVETKRMREFAPCDVHATPVPLHQDHIADVSVNLTKKYRNVEIVQ